MFGFHKWREQYALNKKIEDRQRGFAHAAACLLKNPSEKQEDLLLNDADCGQHRTDFDRGIEDAVRISAAQRHDILNMVAQINQLHTLIGKVAAQEKQTQLEGVENATGRVPTDRRNIYPHRGQRNRS